MHKRYLLIVSALIFITIESCSKKTNPSRSETNKEESSNNPDLAKKTDSIAKVRSAIKRKREKVPTVITVNDQFAKKSVDGRYYYDLQGHRYWRSNKDGKYYLFNKSMATDDAFKKPDQQ